MDWVFTVISGHNRQSPALARAHRDSKQLLPINRDFEKRLSASKAGLAGHGCLPVQF